MSTLERITNLILNKDLNQAKVEIEATIELSKITGRACELNSLQVRDLREAIQVLEVNAVI